MSLLDLIFPKYCVNCKRFGEYLCPDCFSFLSFDTKNICLVCGNPSYNGLTHPRCLSRLSPEGSFTGVVYNPVAKKLVYQFKYKPYLSGLSSFLGDLLYESLIQNEEFNRLLANASNDIFFVPIPLSPSKFKRRGYNQSEILAREVSKKFGFPVSSALLRVKETKSQFSLNKKERKENTKGAFSLNKDFDVRGKNLVLIDDVLTSGATLSEASKVLKKAGAKKVWAVAFAREQ